MPSPAVRPFEPGDRDAWESLFRAYIEFYERELEADVYERTWTELLEDERIHGRGAVLDGKLIGIVHFLVHAHTNANDVCYLQDLFTAPEGRGQGAARALISYVTTWARERNLSKVYWQTKASNDRARRVYDQLAEHRGFIVYQIDL